MFADKNMYIGEIIEKVNYVRIVVQRLKTGFLYS